MWMVDIPRGKFMDYNDESCNCKEGGPWKACRKPHIWLPVGLRLLPWPSSATQASFCCVPQARPSLCWQVGPGQPYQNDGRAEFSGALNEEGERRELGSVVHEQEKALPGPQQYDEGQRRGLWAWSMSRRKGRGNVHGQLGRMVTEESGWRRVSKYHLHFQGN